MRTLPGLLLSLGLTLASALPSAPAAAQAVSQTATAGDIARFIAGIPPEKDSSLTPLTQTKAFIDHARYFDNEWSALEARQLSKVRAFSAANLKDPQKTLFYMFSGPDFLYAEAFFPKAQTYVMSGLEPIGPIPDYARLAKRAPEALGTLQKSLRHIIGFSYFITLDMGKQLSIGPLPGVLPVLYVFIARAGKTVRDVTYMRLDADGKVTPLAASEVPTDFKSRPRVIKITFAGKDNVEQTLYYFNTDLSNKGVDESGFLKFCESLGVGDSFLKSASYLPHNPPFTQVRDFILKNSKTVLQDDTGIAIAQFNERDWTLTPHGKYTRPINVFRGYFQPKMQELFDKGNPKPFDFSLGYRWRQGQSSMLQATRK